MMGKRGRKPADVFRVVDERKKQLAVLADAKEWLKIINGLLAIEDYDEEELTRQIHKRDALLLKIKNIEAKGKKVQIHYKVDTYFGY